MVGIDHLSLLIQFLVTIILVTGALGDNNLKDQQQQQPTNKRFITLSADCSYLVSNGSYISVTLHTSEPFYGSLYSRDHPSSCKSVGDGGTSTKLIVRLDKDCGVQTVPQRAGKLVAARSDEVILEFMKKWNFLGHYQKF